MTLPDKARREEMRANLDWYSPDHFGRIGSQDELLALLDAVDQLEGVKGDLAAARVKAKCYGNIVHGCNPALERAGFPVDETGADGAVGGIARAVEAMADQLEKVEAVFRGVSSLIGYPVDAESCAARLREAIRERDEARARLEEVEAENAVLREEIQRAAKERVEGRKAARHLAGHLRSIADELGIDLDDEEVEEEKP